MNPHAKSYRSRPRPPPPASQPLTAQPPIIGTLTGWPSFPPLKLPVREPANVTQTPNSHSDMGSPAAAIPFTVAYFDELVALVHSLTELKHAGYVLDNLTTEDLESKKRCECCNKYCLRFKASNDRDHRNKTSKLQSSESSTSNGNQHLPGASAVSCAIVPNGHPDAEPPPPKNRCHFHPGKLGGGRPRVWTCCNKPATGPPCAGAPEHTVRAYYPGELEKRWRYLRTPLSADPSSVRCAVAIDCEMGMAVDGEPELIRLTLVDYFTGQILIDQLVYPDIALEHYNTRYSGVTWKMMDIARRNRTCFLGLAKACEAVWKFVGPSTIVVGHSAYNDLKAMRWIHTRVIDSFMLEPEPVIEKKDQDKIPEDEKTKDDQKGKKDVKKGDSNASKATAANGQTSNAKGDQKGKSAGQTAEESKPAKAPKGSGARSLKTLARVKLGREIQNQGKFGHDSIEDALAARDLVHWQVLERRKQAEAPTVPQ